VTLRLAFLSALVLFLPVACATTAPPPEDGFETGGAKATGGKASSGGSPAAGGKTHSGGASPAGGSSDGGNSSGGTFPSGGRSASGGASTSGGAASGGGSSVGGLLNSGGTSSGGRSESGGAPSGGAFSGACAGKPTYEEWEDSDMPDKGDQVVHQCTVIQSACSGLKLKTDYLFECNQSHVNNCLTQRPEDGQSWTYIGECSAASSSGGLGGEGS